MSVFFYIDGDDFLCEFDNETYKMGDNLNSFIDLYDLDYLQDLYGDAGFTQEIINDAVKFSIDNGYDVCCW